MAAVAPPADQASELLQNLSLESKNKTHDAPEVTKKPSGIQYGSTNGVQAPKVQLPSLDRSVTPVLPDYMDHSMCFMPNGYPSTAYYFGGYDGSTGEWEEYTRYMNPEGAEMPHGAYGDVYHHGYGYTPYGPYCSGSPVPAMGHDSQMYGAQHYQYPSPYFQPQASANASYSSNHSPSQGDVAPSAATIQSAVSVDAAKSNSKGVVANVNAIGNSGSMPSKQGQQNSSLISNGSYGRGVLPGAHPSSGYQDSRFGIDGIRSPIPCADGPAYPNPNLGPATANAASSTASHSTSSNSARNQNSLHSPRPTPVMGLATPGVINRMYPTNRMYGQFGNTFRAGVGYGSQVYNYRSPWGMFADAKYKPRARGYGFYEYSNENLDGLSELNKGPRANRLKNQKDNVPTVATVMKGQTLLSNGNVEDINAVPDKKQYNRADFTEKYIDAKFFVIKSYSEDDVHKSIKYNVWASTPNGNKKLDAAYKEASEKADPSPVFLFFSVNASGQFVGVAEMVGPVDFNKTVDYWQQDKWIGCFNVKWHIIKDVPNSILKHITLEYNDNKPVTNSRDTQEVKLEQGLQMLKIFKEHVSKTSILDDFAFYEARQKALLEKRSRQQQHNKQIVDGRLADSIVEKDKDGGNVNNRLQKPLESVKILKKEANPVGFGEAKTSADVALPEVAGDLPKGAKPAAEKRAITNGVANVC
ncbi:hypothetical protein HPP92_013957 [Vanilla planifolia]|uniref:YTH domain-containing family protein n=1 Tax=Vanilla planifolia TaxID=51239 RepID=A0A835UZ43_VANPL|nr:hypothetical protein HPP92_013957 [Vanilla planifolia]